MPCSDESEPKIYLPERAREEYGLDTDMIAGYGAQVFLKAIGNPNKSGAVIKTRVRFKPVETIALFIDRDHKAGGDGTVPGNYKRGWLIKGPGNFFFYVREENFKAFFEIVGEEVQL